jgi:hypothetical protein
MSVMSVAQAWCGALKALTSTSQLNRFDGSPDTVVRGFWQIARHPMLHRVSDTADRETVFN